MHSAKATEAVSKTTEKKDAPRRVSAVRRKKEQEAIKKTDEKPRRQVLPRMQIQEPKVRRIRRLAPLLKAKIKAGARMSKKRDRSQRTGTGYRVNARRQSLQTCSSLLPCSPRMVRSSHCDRQSLPSSDHVSSFRSDCDCSSCSFTITASISAAASSSNNAAVLCSLSTISAPSAAYDATSFRTFST
ncbi:uncharacterized protein LOC119795908 isoform X2 [Cyprinodon tularosa]|uniref:uncharacterized protein LOC119795908 isoform X2 n=1 Tax=Cyprinodon tularosa TaxID=77115 RepID=UPI0018E2604F|nr:uncharacterized protein LOC119795908 isoform X2 [Cyprinodon tularosa]